MRFVWSLSVENFCLTSEFCAQKLLVLSIFRALLCMYMSFGIRKVCVLEISNSDVLVVRLRLLAVEYFRGGERNELN